MAFDDLQSTVQWNQTAENISNHFPGLQHLAEINKLIVNQRFDLEVLCGLETSKTYEVMNNQGQRIYFVEEKNNLFFRHLCGSSRPFTLMIYDNVGQNVITMHKALRCSYCCSSCCLQKLTVEAPPGKTIGYIYQYFRPFWPKFKIKNENYENIVKIRGPCIISSCLWNPNFNLLSVEDEKVIGNISNRCTVFVRGLFTNVEKFVIQFPFDLDVKIKALMLGAGFLINYMYFELCP